MKIENQVCTLEQAKRLKELGVKQESYFFWILDLKKDGYLVDKFARQVKNYMEDEKFSAFTCAELGVMFGGGTRATEWLRSQVTGFVSILKMTDAEWIADTLIKALEGSLLTAAEVNARLELK